MFNSTATSLIRASSSHCRSNFSPVLPGGTTEYTDCTGLLTQSSSAWPPTSLFQIAVSGIPRDKLIIGKPVTEADAFNGYVRVDLSTLVECVSQARGQRPGLGRRCQLGSLYRACVFVGGLISGHDPTLFPDAATSWILTVRGSAFPETAISHGKRQASP
jgi:hypothetical protein